MALHYLLGLRNSSMTLLRVLTALLLFWCAVFPSGFFLIINVKMILVVALFVSFCLFSGKSIFKYRATPIFLAFCLMVIVWSGLGFHHHYPLVDVYGEGRLFLSFGAVIYLVTLMVEDGVFKPETILRMICWFYFVYAVLKIAIVVMDHYISVGSAELVLAEEQYFHIGSLIGGANYLSDRFFTISDIGLPIVLLIILFDYVMFTRKLNLLFFIALTGAIYVGFSRYVWGCYGVVLLLFLLRPASYRLKPELVFLVGSVLAVVGWSFFANRLNELLWLRFQTALSWQDTEMVRYQQTHALFRLAAQSPLWGQGIGSFVPGMLRNVVLPYSYEVQWVALLAKLGIIGFSLLVLFFLIPLFYIFQVEKIDDLWTLKIGGFQLILMIGYILWLASSFTNPYLLTSTSSVIYLVFLMLGYKASRENLKF
jgi:hypothetical protein